MFLPILNRNRSNCELFWANVKNLLISIFATCPKTYISHFLLCKCSFKHSKGSCCCHFVYQTWFLRWYLVFSWKLREFVQWCLYAGNGMTWFMAALSRASAIIHQRMHLISLHTLPMWSANIILTWLSIPGADAWTTDLLTGHYACLNRLIAWDTFVSAGPMVTYFVEGSFTRGWIAERICVKCCWDYFLCLKVTIVRIKNYTQFQHCETCTNNHLQTRRRQVEKFKTV